MKINKLGQSEKSVVLVNRSMYLPGEGGYKRTMFLFDLMRNMGHSPILLTSNFNHYSKQERDIDQFRKRFPEYSDIVILNTGKYKRNISIKRHFVEKEWTKQVVRWVKENIDKIDVIMINMPDMNTILSISEVCKGKKIKIVVDVRDLRPEVFKVLIKNECIYNILTFFMKRKADKAYACADVLTAVSDEYLERGKVNNSHAKVFQTVYIGSVLSKFDNGVKMYSSSIMKPDDEIWLTYAGTLGTSYDLMTVIDAVNEIKENRFNGKIIKFIVLGQGPDRQMFENHAVSVGATNVQFVGFVEYEKMAAYLSKSDITINAIKRRASQSIINKVADYFSAGIPMLNGCTCVEQQRMVEKYNIGLNYEPENKEDLKNKLVSLVNDKEMRIQMGINARKLAEEKFDRNVTYKKLVEILYD